MSMISRQVEELNEEARRMHDAEKYAWSVITQRAADTIAALSAKVADQNLTHEIRTETHSARSDLISRQAAIDVVSRFRNIDGISVWHNGIKESIRIAIIEDLAKLPSADAVGVVRCKDCRHRDLFSCPLADNDFQKDEDFCSWGERRDP